jgi:calcineurin-like phosphoesterase family protein
MTTWFTSDLHFGHKNIIKYCNRPWWEDKATNPTKADVAFMDHELVARWNAVVAPDDVVWNLGYLAFCTSPEHALECLEQLNGVHELLPGNHDELASRLPFGHWNAPVEEINVEGQDIVLCHYAMRTWHHAQRGTWHLFGHSHNLLPPFGKSADVGVDSTQITGKAEYRPFSFAEIKVFMDARPVGVHEVFGEGFVPSTAAVAE